MKSIGIDPKKAALHRFNFAQRFETLKKTIIELG